MGGLLLLRLEFNEITIATRPHYGETGSRDRPRDQPHHDRKYQDHADHVNRYRNRGERRDSFQRRNSDREYDGYGHYDRDFDRDNDRYYDRDYDRNYDRNHDRDIVQA